jgi:hypothetical protein
MDLQQFDIDKVFWEHGKFKPWHIPKDFNSKPLKDLNLNKNKELLLVENDTFSLGFLKSEVIYHHIVQGIKDSKAYMISFCVMCNAGVVMEPLVDGVHLYFEAVGVYSGQLLIKDRKTNSLWNHLTGECIHGDLKGKQLKTAYLKETIVGEEMKINPDLAICISGEQKIIKKVMNTGMYFLGQVVKLNKNFLPPFFVKTIIHEDRTLPRMVKGLVVKIDNHAVFYESSKITSGFIDKINGQSIRLFNEKIPYALDENDKRPFQLFMRWYAFKINYPNGQLFSS